MFLSTTKFGGTKEDKDQKPYPILPHRSTPYLMAFYPEFPFLNPDFRLAPRLFDLQTQGRAGF
jgi:hypothetical protein